MWTWLNTRRQRRYTIEVLRELLTDANLRLLNVTMESTRHRQALTRWADARDAEWTEMNSKDQAKYSAYHTTDQLLHDYVSTLPNEVKT